MHRTRTERALSIYAFVAGFFFGGTVLGVIVVNL